MEKSGSGSNRPCALAYSSRPAIQSQFFGLVTSSRTSPGRDQWLLMILYHVVGTDRWPTPRRDLQTIQETWIARLPAGVVDSASCNTLPCRRPPRNRLDRVRRVQNSPTTTRSLVSAAAAARSEPAR